MATVAWIIFANCLLGALSIVQGFQYIGCFADGEVRDLPQRVGRGSMTVQKCNELCTKQWLPYFGLQDGNDCFCGVGFGRHGMRPTGDCNKVCSGDGNQMCGGTWMNSMYTSDYTASLRYIGCYIDAEDRDLPVLVQLGFMSNGRCLSLCKNKNYAYFGTQDGHECRCGNSYGKHGSRSTEECNKRCNDPEAKEFCGGTWRNSIYATGVSPLQLPWPDPMEPHLRDQLAAQIKTQYIEFPKDVLCTTCLISAWSRRDVEVHSKVIPVRDLNAVLASYPEKVRQKVLPLQYGGDAQTSFEDFSNQISGSNAFRRTYIGMAKRVKDNIQLAMVAANLEAHLATNFNIYYKQICHKILWIFTKCNTHQVQEIRHYDANEVSLIDKAMQSEIFRLLGEKLSQVTV